MLTYSCEFLLLLFSGRWVCNICDPNRGTMKGKRFLEMAAKYTARYKAQLHATSRQKLKNARYSFVFRVRTVNV